MAPEEPQDGDVVSEYRGIVIALHKSLGAEELRISIDYSDSGLTAAIEE